MIVNTRYVVVNRRLHYNESKIYFLPCKESASRKESSQGNAEGLVHHLL